MMTDSPIQSIQSLVTGMSNNIFLSEENLEALFQILFVNQPPHKQLDRLSNKDKDLYKQFESIISTRQNEVINSLEAAQFFESQQPVFHMEEENNQTIQAMLSQTNSNQDQQQGPFAQRVWMESEIDKLERLMRILKSKHKEMTVRKLPGANTNKKEMMQKQKQTKPFINVKFNEEELQSLNALQLVNMSFLNHDLPSMYSSANDCLIFHLNSRYEIRISQRKEQQIGKSLQEISNEKNILKNINFFKNVPVCMFQNNLFPYFSAFELFMLRGVCHEWRDIIRKCWFQAFRREMVQQLRAADLCNEIECHFKMLHIRTPFFHKTGIFLKALLEILDWNTLNASLFNQHIDNANNDNMIQQSQSQKLQEAQQTQQIQQTQQQTQQEFITQSLRKIVFVFFKAMGLESSQTSNQLGSLNDFSNGHWEDIRLLCSNLKQFMHISLEFDFDFASNTDLMHIKQTLLGSNSGINLQELRECNDKNALILCLFIKQMLLFAMLKNSITITQKYLHYTKDKLKGLSEQWPQKKGFLEGAYKILMFSSQINHKNNIHDDNQNNNNNNTMCNIEEKDSINCIMQLEEEEKQMQNNVTVAVQTEDNIIQDEFEQIIQNSTSNQLTQQINEGNEENEQEQELQLRQMQINSQMAHIQHLKSKIQTLQKQTMTFCQQIKSKQMIIDKQKLMRDEAMNKLMLLRLFPVPLMKQNKVNEFDPDFDISCNDYSIFSLTKLPKKI